MLTPAINRAMLFWPIMVIFFASCASNVTQSYPLPQSSLPGKVLTKSMIKNYNISVEDFKNVLFYLEGVLELQGERPYYYKEPAYPNLYLTRINEANTITFSAGTPGRLIRVDTLSGISGKYLRFKIGFGAGGRNSNELVLSFSPDLSGRYTLDHGWIFNKISLEGQDRKYKCVRGCWNNYLRISVGERIINISNRLQPGGRGGTIYTGRGGRP